MEFTMRKQTSNIKYLSYAEKKILFDRIDSDNSKHALRNQAVFYTAKYCALRASEIGLIRITDYDCEKQTLFCQRLKGSFNNTLKILDPKVAKLLNDYWILRKKEAATSDYFFLSQMGKPLSRQMLDFLMKDYCGSSSITRDKCHFHVLKHTRAMKLIEYRDVNIRDVQFWLGHKNINSTMIYLEYTTKSMELLFDKIEIYEGEQRL